MIGRVRRAFGHAGDGLFRNILALVSVQIFRKVLPLITLPYLARVLGLENWGLLAFFQSFAYGVMLFIEFGFGMSATREVARNRNDGAVLNKVCSGAWSVQAVISGIAIAGTSVLALFVPILAKHPWLTVLSLAFSIGEGLNPLWYFLGMERMRLPVRLEIATKTVVAVGIFVVVHAPSDVGIVLGLQALGASFATGWMMWIISQEVPLRRPSRKHVAEAFRVGWPLFILRGAQSGYTASNSFLLGLFAGPVAVSYFAGPEKVTRALVGAFNPIRDAFYPRLTKLSQTSPAAADRLARIGTTVTAIGGLGIGISMYWAAPRIVAILLGPGFEPAIPVMRFLAIVPPLAVLTEALAMQWLLPSGKEKLVIRTMILGGVLNAGLACFLASGMQQRGMVFAVIITECFVSSRLAWAVITHRKQRQSNAGAASSVELHMVEECEVVSSSSSVL